jgi:hypothetical protein
MVSTKYIIASVTEIARGKLDPGDSHLKSYLLGRLRSGRLQFQARPDRKIIRLHLNGKKLGMVSQACHLVQNRRIVVQADLGKK